MEEKEKEENGKKEQVLIEDGTLSAFGLEMEKIEVNRD